MTQHDHEFILEILHENAKTRHRHRAFFAVLAAVSVAWLSLLMLPSARATVDPVAQQIQGAVDDGKTLGAPVVIGGKNGANAQYVKTDGSNNLSVTIAGAAGPVSIAGVTSNAISAVALDTAAQVFNTGAFTASNGATPVVLKTATGGKTTYVTWISVRNTDTIYHLVSFQTSTGPATIYPCYVPPSGEWGETFVVSTMQTNPGDSLQFVIDASGSGSSVGVSVGGVQK